MFELIRNDPTMTTKSLKKQFKAEEWENVRKYRNQCLNVIYPTRKKVSQKYDTKNDLDPKVVNNSTLS